MVASDVLGSFIKKHPQTTFVIDESYLPFCNAPSLVSGEPLENLFILCSSSKIYGIPGLRLGFLVSTEQNMAAIKRRCRPWTVNRLAQLAGEFLFSKADSYVREVQSFVKEERAFIVKELQGLSGLDVIPGAANFVLCRLTTLSASQLTDNMLAQKIMIRNCASFDGLDESYFRFSLKKASENRLFLTTLTSVLNT